MSSPTGVDGRKGVGGSVPPSAPAGFIDIHAVTRYSGTADDAALSLSGIIDSATSFDQLVARRPTMTQRSRSRLVVGGRR